MDRIRYTIGLLTLGVALAAGWFMYGLLDDDDQSGLFQLRIEFYDVRGLKVGSDVRYRGVQVGVVRDVELSRDGEKGAVTVLLHERGASLATQRSRFWVVVPRFGGITAGASGLETLVRDAYVAFETPTPHGPPLPTGSLLQGVERPEPVDPARDLEPIRRGDLSVHLLVPESHGLTVGAEVRFRGIAVGDVRHITLGRGGEYVDLVLRIRQAHRQTVTGATEFWIARPRLSGALLSGIALEDLGALLTPFVGYYTPQGEHLPVADGYRVIAGTDRPDMSDDDVPESALAAPPSGDQTATSSQAVRTVDVIYEAEETDWLSANDHAHRRSTGLLYVDGSGRLVVVTPRSACDGSYFMADLFGSPDIATEAILVEMPDGGIYRSGRTWIDPGGADLALLVIESAPPDQSATESSVIDVEWAGEPAVDHVQVHRSEAPIVWSASDQPRDLQVERGAVALRDGSVVGVVGQSIDDAELAVVVPLSLLPEELRPAR